MAALSWPDHDGSPPMVIGGEPVTAAVAAAWLAARLTAAVHRDDARLARARTSVAFLVGTCTVTLALDGRQSVVAEGDAPSEVRLVLTPEYAWQLARGELHIGPLVATREIPAYGPVRKFLAVSPVLRGRLASVEAACR